MLMNNYSRHLIIKFLLIVGAEALAFWLTDLFSKYIHPIQFTTLVYVILGAILAFLVVVLYDKFFILRKRKIEVELKTLTDVALRRFDVDEK